MDADELAAYEVRLRAKLEPPRIRVTLAFAGLYQLTHELIKTNVLDQVRQFYMVGFDESGYLYDEHAYRTKVLDRAPKRKMKARYCGWSTAERSRTNRPTAWTRSTHTVTS